MKIKSENDWNLSYLYKTYFAHHITQSKKSQGLNKGTDIDGLSVGAL